MGDRGRLYYIGPEVKVFDEKTAAEREEIKKNGNSMQRASALVEHATARQREVCVLDSLTFNALPHALRRFPHVAEKLLWMKVDVTTK